MSTEVEHLITGRPRDLGGLHVARVLPAIRKRSVGPYVFLDHMGPEDAEITVRPHPHIHLATVTYLFSGELHHRDSLGTHQVIQPGAINWMTAGKGIVHSERSQGQKRMHGLQLWVGLPRATEESEASFVHYPAEALPEFSADGAHVRVLVGTTYGVTSPVATLSPMFYLDVKLEAGARLGLPTGYEERAVYVTDGSVMVGSERVECGQLAVVARGMSPVVATNGSPARLIFLGGEPLDGPRYMWWNFVSSSKERILDAAHEWRAGQFPTVPDDDKELIPAPADDPNFATTYHHPTDQQLRTILEEARTIAIVGASSDAAKPSHRIMEQLLRAGYRVIPVNPKETEVLGQPAVKSLREIDERVDIVDVFRKAEDTPPIADDAIAIGAKVLWLQYGVSSEEAAARALLGGLAVVMDTCIGATHRRLHIAPRSV